MLARCRELKLGKRRVGETPLLVPALSSRGFLEADKVLRCVSEFITDSMLVSAYDWHSGNLGQAPDLGFVGLLLLDSGGYEMLRRADFSDVKSHRCEVGRKLKNHKDQEWNREMLADVIERWPMDPEYPATLAISYDEPEKPLQEQVRSAQELFEGQKGLLKELLIKPETETQKYVPHEVVVKKVELLAPFDAIGFTEQELGNSLLQRMERIAKIRIAMDQANINLPIHVLGGLDPVSTPLYYIAGAEIFDGVSWLRYGYRHGLTVYKRNYGALYLGLHCLDDHVETRCWVNNLSVLTNLALEMKSFWLRNGSFESFAYNADLFERAFHDLCAKLGREV